MRPLSTWKREKAIGLEPYDAGNRVRVGVRCGRVALLVHRCRPPVTVKETCNFRVKFEVPHWKILRAYSILGPAQPTTCPKYPSTLYPLIQAVAASLSSIHPGRIRHPRRSSCQARLDPPGLPTILLHLEPPRQQSPPTATLQDPSTPSPRLHARPPLARGAGSAWPAAASRPASLSVDPAPLYAPCLANCGDLACRLVRRLHRPLLRYWRALTSSLLLFSSPSILTFASHIPCSALHHRSPSPPGPGAAHLLVSRLLIVGRLLVIARLIAARLLVALASSMSDPPAAAAMTLASACFLPPSPWPPLSTAFSKLGHRLLSLLFRARAHEPQRRCEVGRGGAGGKDGRRVNSL
ncbi:hypothetical protein BS78_03G333000 [Paspalum vaginatum]|nr:hypothetical protein BS78_03G333000 [Paspalum vaginatum]